MKTPEQITLDELARVQAQRDRLAEELRSMRAMRDEYRRELLELLALYHPVQSVIGDWDWAGIAKDGCWRAEYADAVLAAVNALAEVAGGKESK